MSARAAGPGPAVIVGWLLALALVTLPVVALLNGWFAADRWPIRTLRVTAEYTRVSAEQVRTAVAPHVDRGFFALPLEDIRASLAALPWVERVEVRKRWPQTLEITLHEHRAVARWGRERLLSDRGVVFDAPGARDMQGLPLLDGPDTRVRDVVDAYGHARDVLASAGLTAIGMRLTRRGSWRVQLEGGADLVVGRGDPLPRLVRFARVAPKLLGTERRGLARADLRYPNGFAITWQPAAAGAAAAGNPST